MVDESEVAARIHRITNGSGLTRENFPEERKGNIAEGCWHEPFFSYGMEYGYLLAMFDLQKGQDSTI